VSGDCEIVRFGDWLTDPYNLGHLFNGGVVNNPIPLVAIILGVERSNSSCFIGIFVLKDFCTAGLAY